MRLYKRVLWSDVFRRKDEKTITNPKILYSYLVSVSVIDLPSLYDESGAFLRLNLGCLEGDFIPLAEKYVTTISGQTNISRRSVYYCLEYLKDIGLIKDGQLYIIEGLLTGGYFELCTGTGLRGMDLIVYSYVVWRTQMASEKCRIPLTEIDTFAEKFAAELNTRCSTIRKSFSYCEKAGWLIRKARNVGGFIRWYISAVALNQDCRK